MLTVIISIAVAAVLVAVILIYNTLVASRNKVKEAFATMDVYLRKRFDLLPALVSVVKAYSEHEASVLEQTVAKRGAATSLTTTLDSETSITDAISSILVVAENYPDLKASDNYLDLSGRIVKIEDDIASARRYYNGAVREYNDRCQIVPQNIIAAISGFKPMPMFKATAEERELNMP